MSLAAGVLSAALALPPQGLIAAYDFARANFVNWSEDLTNAAWAKNRVDATPNRATVSSNPTGFDYVWQSIPSAAQGQTITAYADMMQGNGAVTDLRVLTNNGSIAIRSARIRWSDRTLIPHPDNTTLGAVTTEERGGGVLRVTITVTLPALTAGTGMFIYPNGWNSALTPGIYVDVLRAQWQLGSPAGYEKQTDAQVLLDRSVRLWPAPAARTNLLSWSEELDLWSRSRIANVFTNATVAPNGTMTADKVIPDTTPNLPHALSWTLTGTAKGSWQTASCYFKAGEYTRVRLAMHVTDGTITQYPTAWWDVATGSLIQLKGMPTLVADQSTSITPVGNGWYRCVLSVLTVASASCNRVEVNAAGAADNSEYGGTFDGVGGWFAWGAMCNVGPTALPYEQATDGVIHDLSQRGMRNLISNSELARTSDTAAPTGWSLQIPTGLTASWSYGVAASGVPYAQLTLTGAVSSPGQAFNIYMAPTGMAGVPITPSTLYSVSANVTQVSGPALGVQAGMHQWSASGSYVGTSGSSVPTPTGEEPRRITGAAFTLPTALYGTPRLGASVAWPIESSQTRVYRFSQPQVELGSAATTYQRSPSHATLGSSSNADSNDPAWTPQGLVFDGVDDFIAVPGVAGESGETLIFRVPGNTNRAGEVATVYSQGQQSGGPTPYLWVYYVSNAITIQLADGQDRVTNSFSTVAPGTLVAITADYASGRIRYYENGTLKSAVTHVRPFLPVRSAVARIGCYSISLTHTASGTQSWLSRHTRALSDAEVHQAYRFIRNQLSRRGVTI